MNKFISCCLLIALWMGLLPCTLIASAVGDEETANACTSPAEFRIDWTIENEGTDSTGFDFAIKIYSRPKYCELDSGGNVKSSEYISYDTDSKFIFNEAKTNLHCYGSTIFIDIYGKSQELSKYPNASEQTETAFSRILSEKTQQAELAKLEVMAADVKDMAGAEQLMTELIEYLSTPYEETAPPKNTPSGRLWVAIGGGAAIVAIPTVSLLLIKRKRQRGAT